MNNALKCLIVFFLFTASSCTMPETRIYSILSHIERTGGGAAADMSIVIHVDSEDYLKQPYIVLRKSPYQLTISRYAKWDTSPRNIMRREFVDALSSTALFNETRTAYVTPRGFYALKIYLRRFERLEEGDTFLGLLDMDITFLSPDGKVLFSDMISQQEQLEGKELTSLAAGLSNLLQKNIEEIKENIIRVVEEQVNTFGE
jgi:uncharacterized lipoprotein YmbA